MSGRTEETGRQGYRPGRNRSTLKKEPQFKNINAQSVGKL